ncbi:hypothetical protein GCM10009808_15820 [Microbacterium sediminicola]|uniref:DNA polymerase III subunit gamma/tau n=1 Tax=Microbacterium sediminicola TaxID=415210 RepID=A0ABN2I5Q9_9MICO
MTTALYRRYRPEAFGEMIGQTQVTEPLMTALRGDRVGHAYLFSGPRGCGKTTSARILARCLNCAEGPTDTPCGTCESCVELGRGGGGSLDVVEIDAASHGGVDDARDLRERAVFAPARDRFKIFIIDEAHMVTAGGFNALLKLVEEPPDHVKFIFATTEPEKVIGTIRSRTHHYPFRLVPPAAMLEYVEALCQSEGVSVEPGVLPLVVRAGGGSPRDTLSLLDQLIAGSEGTVGYERAVALLGYTHAELLDEIVTALADADPGAVFAAVDRVVQTGQDPRRFVDDLLERLRDLIVVGATGSSAGAVLRGVSAEELARMAEQAERFGVLRLSQTADIVVAALDEMTGATSPRLQLELMCARVLARGVAPSPNVAGTSVGSPASGPAPAAPSPVERSGVPVPAPEPVAPEPTVPSGPITLAVVRDSWEAVMARLEGISRTSWLLVSGATVADFADQVLTLTFARAADVAKFKQLLAGAGPSEDLRTAIKSVLGIRVKYIARHDGGDGGPGGGSDTAGSGPGGDVPPAARSVSDAGESLPSTPSRAAGPTPPPAAPPASSVPASAGGGRAIDAGVAPRAQVAAVTEWAVAPIPADAVAPFETALAVDDEPEEAESRPADRGAPDAREGDVIVTGGAESGSESDDPEVEFAEVQVDAPVVARPIARAASGQQRYGEAVVRQVLGARFVREEPHSAPTRFG